MNETINWKDNTSNFNGKQLKATVWLDDDTLLECHLWYTQYIPAGRQVYSVGYAERKELGNVITLHVTKMRRSLHAFTGGLGRTVAVSDKRYTRKTLKDLQNAAERVTMDDVLTLGEIQSTNPTKIVG